LSVPPPEFHTWKVCLEAFDPLTQEGEREVGFLEMAGAAAFTVRVTGMVRGVLLAPVAAMVIVAV
jgi:hypothetical protein